MPDDSISEDIPEEQSGDDIEDDVGSVQKESEDEVEESIAESQPLQKANIGLGSVQAVKENTRNVLDQRSKQDSSAFGQGSF